MGRELTSIAMQWLQDECQDGKSYMLTDGQGRSAVVRGGDCKCELAEQSETLYASVNCVNVGKSGATEFPGRDCVAVVVAKNADAGDARKAANGIYLYLRDQGFSEPIVSGGEEVAILKYKCAIRNDAESAELVMGFLGALSLMFGGAGVAVLHSQAECAVDLALPLLPRARAPKEWAKTDRRYFEKVAKAGKSILDGVHGSFVRALSRAGESEGCEVDGITRHELKECVFDPSHKGMIFELGENMWSYHCLHPGCSCFNSLDAKAMLFPDNASEKLWDALEQKALYNGLSERPLPKGLESEGESIWLSHPENMSSGCRPRDRIPTGYPELDRKIGSLLPGDVTIVSGRNASGKTIWLDTVCLNAINRGFKCAVWSGELRTERFYGWVDCIAAGKAFTEQKQGYDGYYDCKPQAQEKITQWLKGKMYLYNNSMRSGFSQILEDARAVVKRVGVNLVVFDNLASLDLSDYEGRDYDRQKLFIVDLKQFAKDCGVHAIAVCHPRKSTQFLRKEDISGSADLTNLCDNLLIIHRVNNDFSSRVAEYLGQEQAKNLSKYSTVVEIAKNRLLGAEDCYIGLTYEPESKRIKSSPAEHVVYGWQEPIFQIDRITNKRPVATEQDQMPTAETPFE